MDTLVLRVGERIEDAETCIASSMGSSCIFMLFGNALAVVRTSREVRWKKWNRNGVGQEQNGGGRQLEVDDGYETPPDFAVE